MLPVRIISIRPRSTFLLGEFSSRGTYRNSSSSASIRTAHRNNDWSNQTIETINGEEVSFLEVRKHKLDVDTVYNQDFGFDQLKKETNSVPGKQDERIRCYEPCAVGLSGVMQTNVPEPFDGSTKDNQDQFLLDHTMNLNMPGGTVALKAKYLSGQLNMLDIDQSRH